jgi:hypothetical protein
MAVVVNAVKGQSVWPVANAGIESREAVAPLVANANAAAAVVAKTLNCRCVASAFHCAPNSILRRIGSAVRNGGLTSYFAKMAAATNHALKITAFSANGLSAIASALPQHWFFTYWRRSTHDNESPKPLSVNVFEWPASLCVHANIIRYAC